MLGIKEDLILVLEVELEILLSLYEEILDHTNYLLLSDLSLPYLQQPFVTLHPDRKLLCHYLLVFKFLFVYDLSSGKAFLEVNRDTSFVHNCIPSETRI